MPGTERSLLQGQKALVTGAATGIGRATAIALGKAGADVVVNWHTNEEAAASVVEEIRATKVEAYAYHADVSNEDEVQNMFKHMIDRLGTVDVLVNNAGIQKDAPFAEMTLGQWEKVVSVNLTGQFLCAREAVREFMRRGVVESVSCSAGKIICMSSVHEIIPWAGHVNYAASKGGVMLMMKSIAQEVAAARIRVNSIAPGAIKTGINRGIWSSDEKREALLDRIPYRRIGAPEEVGRVAAWLASDQADYVTGETIVVDGGMALYPSFRNA